MSRRKFESVIYVRRTATRFIIVAALLFVAVTFAMRNARMFLLWSAPANKAEPLIFTGAQGIVATDNKGVPQIVHPLNTREGEPLIAPRWAFVQGNVVYVSREDQAVIVLQPDGSQKSIALPSELAADEEILDVRRIPSGVMVGIWKLPRGAGNLEAKQLLATVVVDLLQGKAERLEKPVDMRVSSDGKTSVATTQSGRFTLTKGTRTSDLTLIANPSTWDYDFDNNVLAVSDGGSVWVYDGKETLAFRPALFYGVRRLSVRPSKKEIWVEMTKPFSAGSLLATFSYQGEYLGVKLTSKARVRGPYYAVSSRTDEILAKLPTAQYVQAQTRDALAP